MHKIVILLTFLLFPAISMAGQLGPAQSLGKPGEFSLGTGFFYYNAELEGGAELAQKQAYIQAGLGLFRNWELYLQAGAADMEIEDVFDDGYRPFGTVGLRGLILEREPVSLGIFAQGTYFSDYEDNAMEVEKQYELNAGLAFQAWIEKALLYGGPLFYLREGDVVGAGSFEEDSNVGGFLGIRWPLKNGYAIEVETQIKTDISVGGSVHLIF